MLLAAEYERSVEFFQLILSIRGGELSILKVKVPTLEETLPDETIAFITGGKADNDQGIRY